MQRSVLFLLVAALPMAGRKVPTPKPNVKAPAAFENQPAGAEPVPATQWWRALRDPLLDELLERASRTNLDVRKAGARIAEARALSGGARSALLPSIDSAGSAVQLRGGFNQGVVRVPNTPDAAQSASFVTPFDSGLVLAGFNMRWEADIFGGIRKSVKATSADERVASENARDVQALVRAELARNYIELRAAEEQMELVKAHAAAQQERLDLIRARADAGLASQLDVERQIVELTSARALLPELDAHRVRSAHRIAVLAGEYPDLKDSLRSVLVAINREYAFDEAVVPPNAEIALFPPVSGG